MQHFPSQQAFHQSTAPVFAMLSQEQLYQMAHLQADSSATARVDALATLANEGRLSPQEHLEYEAYIEANNLLAILQAEAQFRLTQNTQND